MKEVLEQMGSEGIGYVLQQKLMPNGGYGMSEATKDTALTLSLKYLIAKVEKSA